MTMHRADPQGRTGRSGEADPRIVSLACCPAIFTVGSPAAAMPSASLRHEPGSGATEGPEHFPELTSCDHGAREH